MSRAVSPFTICITFTDSGIRGSKKRTSPLTLQDKGPGGGLLMATLGILPGAPGRDLALKDGVSGHAKFQCPLAHAGKAKGLPGGVQIPTPCHPLVLAARIPIKLPVSGQTRLGLTKGSCHAHTKQDTPGSEEGSQARTEQSCQRLQREVEPMRAEDGRGSLVDAQPLGARSPLLGSQPSASVSTPGSCFALCHTQGGKNDSLKKQWLCDSELCFAVSLTGK